MKFEEINFEYKHSPGSKSAEFDSFMGQSVRQRPPSESIYCSRKYTVADVMAISLDRLLAQVHLGVAFENGLARSKKQSTCVAARDQK